jgi:hypothetical protein
MFSCISRNVSRTFRFGTNLNCIVMDTCVQIVSYDGSDFNGYQLQRGRKDARTVQSTLEMMLCTLFRVKAESLSMNVFPSCKVATVCGFLHSECFT